MKSHDILGHFTIKVSRMTLLKASFESIFPLTVVIFAPFQLRPGITFSMSCQTAWDLMMPNGTMVTRQMPPKTRHWCNRALTLAGALGDIFLTGFHINLRLRARALWNTISPICMGKVGGFNPLTHWGRDKYVILSKCDFNFWRFLVSMKYCGVAFVQYNHYLHNTVDPHGPVPRHQQP